MQCVIPFTVLFAKITFHCCCPWLAVKTCTGFKQRLKVFDNITSDVQMMYNKNLYGFTCKTSHAMLNFFVLYFLLSAIWNTLALMLSGRIPK